MNYTINICDLEKAIKEANKDGYPAFVIINGEYYNIDFSEKKGE